MVTFYFKKYEFGVTDKVTLKYRGEDWLRKLLIIERSNNYKVLAVLHF